MTWRNWPRKIIRPRPLGKETDGTYPPKKKRKKKPKPRRPKRDGSARPGNVSPHESWRPPSSAVARTSSERTYRMHLDHLMAEYVDEIGFQENRPRDVVLAALVTMGYLVYRRLRADVKLDKGFFSLGARHSGAQLVFEDVKLFGALCKATQEEVDAWFVRHREEFERGRDGDDGHGGE